MKLNIFMIKIKANICLLFEGKAAEEEGRGEGGAELIFPKEEGEKINMLFNFAVKVHILTIFSRLICCWTS